ncbi:protease B [Fulvivirga imtechensis AK7]|uniref:Protease B n=1 Tax=Fulvivirga imtechensis AK7 TaxID=1237149 RepID=L8JN49_9BACT|nr:M57 family metalloprotease [Fulvivirga imtechensis]ELR70366.1 protease B [Fulvivirga imtechensis AK7]
MRKLNHILALAIAAGFLFFSCENENVSPGDEVPEEILSKLTQLGFSTDGVMRFEDGFLVENDIYLTAGDIHRMSPGHNIPVVEQYSTDNLVTATPRVITVYMPTGRKGFSSGEQAGLDEAIRRYNAENLTITFQRVTSSSADIVFQRLSKGDERRGILGSAGFPTASGDPYGTIKMSGILESTYGLSTDGIATIMAHEMGHCIGFRHTDYFDRSISCGGGTANEGSGSIGANHIPGTPTGADLQGNGSWMLACTDGSSRPFTNADKTALNYLY